MSLYYVAEFYNKRDHTTPGLPARILLENSSNINNVDMV